MKTIFTGAPPIVVEAAATLDDEAGHFPFGSISMVKL